jgi:hypothetical protein
MLKLIFNLSIMLREFPARISENKGSDIWSISAIIFNSKTAIDHFFRLCGEIKDCCA